MHSGARNPNRGGVNPPDKDGSNLTITIPGGFSVASTRTAGNPRGAEGGDTGTRAGETRLTDTEEKDIDNLYMLLFAESDGGDPADPSDDELEAVRAISAASITDGDAEGEYKIRVQLPTGTHRIVMLANSMRLDDVPGVQIGDYVWAKTNLDTYQKFAALESDYGRLYQFGSAAMPEASKVAWPGNGNQAAISAGNPGKAWSTGADVAIFNYPAAWDKTGGWDLVTNNPCPPDWTVPTWAQWANLLDNTTQTSVADIVNGVSGRKLVSKADPNVRLFLPFTGNRANPSGAVSHFAYGLYWSSTPKDAPASEVFNLGFYGGSMAGQWSNQTNSALAVRCVSSDGGTRAVAGDLVVGQTYEQVREALVGDLSGKMYTDGGSIPMWGEVGYTDPADPIDPIALHRAIARIDVGEGAWDEETDTWAVGGLANFELTDVVVVRPNNRYSVIPSALDADGVPDAPSVPAGAAAYTVAESASRFTYTTTAGAPISGQIYIPEAEVTSLDHDNRMALIVGGKYNGSTTVTWYRVGFRRPDGTLIDVVRNHLYRFAISSVSGPGEVDIPTADESQIQNLNVSVVDWDEENFPTNLGR